MTTLRLENGIRELVTSFISSGSPSVYQQTLEERRQGYRDSAQLAGSLESVYQVTHLQIDDAQLKIYKPSNDTNMAVAVYFHGGCFVSGGFDTHEQQLRKLANLSGAIVVAMEYRLAPEHTYPAAHDDALHATQIVYKHCRSWGGNPQNITFVGDSAGGHLSLITSLRLRDLGNWQPTKQVLIYPMLDATAGNSSYIENGEHYLITRETLLSGFDMYLNELPRKDSEASPLFRQDLHSLPETHILAAEFDPLVDEGKQLYHQLIESGVNAHYQFYPNVIHGFFQLSGISQSARASIQYVAQVISEQ